MTRTYVEIIAASASLLPPLCQRCLFWQATSEALEDPESARLEWLDALSLDFGSCGVAAVYGGTPVGAVQFAPLQALPRAAALLENTAPPGSAFLFCLRLRPEWAHAEAKPLLHRAIASLHARGVPCVYAFARPAGSPRVHSLRNVFGLEFLRANGFRRVARVGQTEVLCLDLRGLVPAVRDLVLLFRSLHRTPTPSPVS